MVGGAAVVATLMDLGFAVSVGGSVLGILGILIGGWITRHYAKQATRDLEHEARRLAEQTAQASTW